MLLLPYSIDEFTTVLWVKLADELGLFLCRKMPEKPNKIFFRFEIHFSGDWRVFVDGRCSAIAGGGDVLPEGLYLVDVGESCNSENGCGIRQMVKDGFSGGPALVLHQSKHERGSGWSMNPPNFAMKEGAVRTDSRSPFYANLLFC